MDKAFKHLKEDKKLAAILDQTVVFDWNEGVDLYIDIAESIVGQQLSGKAADAITARIREKSKSKKEFPSPSEILSLPDQILRDCGLSWAKVKYIKSLAEAVKSKTLDVNNLVNLDDEAVIVELTKIKGIGRWTAEMILIFSLKRPDVFSIGDLGLRTAVARLYNIDRENLKKIAKISEKWKPYRSLASRYLWKSLDNR